MMYCDPNCKPWTSRHWAPEGFASRRDFVEQGRAAEAHKPLEAGAGEESRFEHAEKGRQSQTGTASPPAYSSRKAVRETV